MTSRPRNRGQPYSDGDALDPDELGWRSERMISDFEDPPGIPGEQLSEHLFIRRQPPQRGDCLGALAAGNCAQQIVAIASVNQLVLMALQEFAGMVFIALQRVETGAG